MHTSYIGLGSNLMDPTGQLTRALHSLARLAQCSLRACSSFYRSHAIGPGNQPDYINAAARLDTDLEPAQLLAQLQDIERDQGRLRLQHWGPRTLDLDLLLFDRLKLDTPLLQVPHPRMHQRAFVLVPLAEICPRLALPGGSTITELLANTGAADVVMHCPAPAIEVPQGDAQT
jgi:2-amino-4-hydroxy-6-hydroxymethyldihydropteridine diphosphokinase